MKKPLTGLTAVFLGVCLLFYGCAPYVDYSSGVSSEEELQSADGVSLRVWCSQADQSAMKSLCSEFAGKIYNISYGNVPEDAAAEELLKAQDNTADVFGFSADQLPALVEAGALLPVENAEEVLSANTAASAAAAAADGQIYAYPASVSTYYLYYDLSKLRAEEVLSLESILDRDCGAEVNFAMNFSEGYYTSAFFLANGCDPFRDAASLTGEAGLAAARALEAAASHPKTASLTDDEIVEGFRTGRIAAAVSGSWNADAVSGALGSNYACAKLPTVQIDGEDKQLVSLGSFRLFGVSAKTEHPREAQALANRLASADGQRVWLEQCGLSPTNLALLEDASLMSPEIPEKEDAKQEAARILRKSQAAAAEQGAYVSVLAADPRLPQMWEAFRAFGQTLTAGEGELEEQVSRLASALSGE